jgi:membrane protease YdiL (CAAX protease family)
MKGLDLDDLDGRRWPPGSGGQERGPSRATLVLALYGGLTLIALVWGLYTGRLDIYHHPDAERAEWRLWLSPLIGAAAGLVVVAISRLVVRRFDWARTLHTEFRAVLLPLSHQEIVVMALASSVGEEALFRGAMVPSLGLVTSTLLFAALHVAPTRRLFVRMLPWTASALVIGLGLGALYEAVGDLGAPVAAHFVINYLNLRFISSTPTPASAR